MRNPAACGIIETGDNVSDSILLLHGTDPYSIKQAAEQAVADAKIALDDVLSFDMEETPLEEAIEAAMTIPFFSDRKAVILRNATFLTAKPAKDMPQDVNVLARYFEHPSPATLLIVLVPSDKLECKKELLSLLELHGSIRKFETAKKQDLYEMARSIVATDGMRFEPDALEELIRRIDENVTMLERELEKIRLYAMDADVITLAMIESITPRNLEDNVYELINQIVAKNKATAMRMLQDLTRLNVDPVYLMQALSGKFQELLTAKALIKSKMTYEEMMRHFGYSKGRMYYVQKNASEMDADLLARYLDDLGTLDFKVKSGQIDKLMGFEMFLMSI
jgi:DNA polymerase-3 subunit delta